MDLLRAHKIEDPYYRDNERRLGWVGDQTWLYEREFSVSEADLSHPKILLVFRGLDTLATVTLNERVVLSADNMHRTWEVDITDKLRAGTNQLRVQFDPVLPYLKKKDKIQPRTHGWADFRAHNAGWIRKQPCNFGWDWGPILLTCGIWRDVELQFLKQGRITDFECRQRHNKSQVALDLKLHTESIGRAKLRVKATLSLWGKRVASGEAECKRGVGHLKLAVRSPKLWWPNGLGEQTLYDLNLELVDEKGALVDQLVRRIGVRSLTLRRKNDRFGQSFEFVVNGVPFFAKGANWVPADTFAPRVKEEHYRELIEAAKHANMNMLRVWGGNVYEADAF
jgi:beta-mannosidase